MTINREVLEKLLSTEESLLTETELVSQSAPPDYERDRDWRHYHRALQRNVTRIQRILSDAGTFWAIGGQRAV